MILLYQFSYTIHFFAFLYIVSVIFSLAALVPSYLPVPFESCGLILKI